MDKKLIVDVKEIEYLSKKSQVKSSYDDLKKNMELLPKVLRIFQKIHIENLKIDGNQFTISLNDEELYLDNKFINISSKIDFISKNVVLDLYSLYLKDVDIMLDGKIKVDYLNEKINHFGKYYYKNLEGDLKFDINIKKKIIDFYLNSNRFKSLSFLKKYLKLSSIAESWMYDKVKGDLKLEEFYGSFDLNKNQVIESSLKARGNIKKALIKYNSKLSPLKVEKINVFFENDNLLFLLEKPSYEDISIKGSKVLIENLTSEEKGKVIVDIKALNKLDNRVLNILKAYKIKLPVIQKSGQTKAFLKLEIPYSIKKDMKITGKFSSKNAKISINKFDFFSKKVDVILNNNIIKIQDSHFKIDKMLDSTIKVLSIDSKTLTAKGEALINNFIIKSKTDEIIRIKNKKTNLDFDFNNPVSLNLKDLYTKINISKNVSIHISKLEELYKYSNLMQKIPVKKGNLNIEIIDDNTINFEGFVDGLVLPLEKNNQKLRLLNIKGKLVNDVVEIFSKDKSLSLKIKDNEFFIKLNDFTVLSENNNSDESVPPMNIEGNNINLKVKDEEYNLKFVNAQIKNNDITFDAKIGNLDLPIRKDNKKIELLDIQGSVKNELISINSKDKSLSLKIFNNRHYEIDLNGYDVYINTINEEDNTLDDFEIKAKNSNIFINEKYKFLAKTYELKYKDKSIFFHLNHNATDITYKKDKNAKVDIFANDINDEFINTIYNKKILNGGKLMVLANGKNDDIKGKVVITDVKIEDLAIINNLLIFIHASPALINPLLAVPSVVGMASNEGFNLNGYRITDGVMEFDYKRKQDLLDITKLITIGNGIDFDGKGKIDLKAMKIDSKIKLIFFKNYSSIVSALPVVNYVLLGKDKRVETEVNIFGALNNPKISTNLTKDAFSVPLNIGKRILTSPIELFNFIKGEENKKD